MITLALSEHDLMLLDLAVQELPEKARLGLGARINPQIAAQLAAAKAAKERSNPKSSKKPEDAK